MEQPTDEQIKEFWEWFGFVDTFEGDTGAYYWKAPNGDAGIDLPPLDLNNLFKYAVPKLRELHFIEFQWWEVEGCHVKVYVLDNSFSGQDGNPALALFWAIWEVTHNGE